MKLFEQRHDFVRLDADRRCRAARSTGQPGTDVLRQHLADRQPGTYADGVNIRLSSPHSARYLAAARDAAGDRPFETTGWASKGDQASIDKAHELHLDRLIISLLSPL